MSTGKCQTGQIAAPGSIRDKPYASYDLGLVLFTVAERFGRRFGEEPPPGSPANPENDALLVKRSQEIDCALQISRVIAADKDLPAVLRAQAYYLSGNLELLRGEYKDAVSNYDACLRLVPGDSADSGLTLGDDAAYNRAIALRRLEEQEKQQQPPDAGKPENNPDDSSKEQGDNSQKDQEQQGDPQDQNEQQDQQEQQQQDQSKDNDSKKADPQAQNEPQQQAGGASGAQQEPAPGEQQESKGPSLSQDERILDLLEQAPTVQHQQAAAQRGRGRVVRGMEDK